MSSSFKSISPEVWEFQGLKPSNQRSFTAFTGKLKTLPLPLTKLVDDGQYY